MPLHEWNQHTLDGQPSSADELITWLFEADSFAPLARLTPQVRYSVVSDHLGRPLELADEGGGVVWGAQLDSYGRVRQGVGKAGLCPFRYQGQYEDQETGLYYNRFRYYDPQTGGYISQDPIGLIGGFKLFSYVSNPNKYVDKFGLESTNPGVYDVYHESTIPGEMCRAKDAVHFSEGNRQLYYRMKNDPAFRATLEANTLAYTIMYHLLA